MTSQEDKKFINKRIKKRKHCVISSFVVPWTMGIGIKNSHQAKSYIKYGETLNPLYFPRLEAMVKECGEEKVYQDFMRILFCEENVDEKLTEILGEKVYKPRDGMSGIYHIDINEKMGLFARPYGITKDNECVVMIDKYLDDSNYREDTDEELEVKLLATMAVWEAKKGVCYIEKTGEIIYKDFDSSKWEKILTKIKSWAEFIL